MCFSKDNNLILPTLASHKISRRYYPPNEVKESCLYFQFSECVFNEPTNDKQKDDRHFHSVNQLLCACSWASYQIRKNAGSTCAGNVRGTFSPPSWVTLAIPTCCDACRDRKLAVSFKVGGGENVPDTPGAHATHNIAYLVRGPCDTVTFDCVVHLIVRSDNWYAGGMI